MDTIFQRSSKGSREVKGNLTLLPGISRGSGSRCIISRQSMHVEISHEQEVGEKDKQVFKDRFPFIQLPLCSAPPAKNKVYVCTLL